MQRISAIITCICFFSVTILEYGLCSLCLLVICPQTEAVAENPEPSSCQACCPSQMQCEPTDCDIPEEIMSACDISPCFLPDQPPTPVCVIDFEPHFTISTGCSCSINPPELGDALAERRGVDSNSSFVNTPFINGTDGQSSDIILTCNSQKQGIHSTIAMTVLRL